MFHAHDGWFFERLPGGSVRIVKRAAPRDDAEVIAEGVFQMNGQNAEWASIIASVSRGGEDDLRFFSAVKFHDSDGMVDIVPTTTDPATTGTPRKEK
mgnify:CR=1 FL=1